MSATRVPSRTARVVGVLLAVSYPPAVYFGVTRFGADGVALVVLTLLVPAMLLRVRHAERARVIEALRPLILTFALVALAAWNDNEAYLKALPVLANLALLIGFGASLRHGSVPMIERFARLHRTEIPEFLRRYCRAFTLIWCAFFLANALGAALVAIFAPIGWWALYTGLISYVLVAALLGAERLARTFLVFPRSEELGSVS